MQWQPIETAPTDRFGNVILWDGQTVFVGWFDSLEGGWMEVEQASWEGLREPQPTHWMPLPPPPGGADE